VIPGNDDAIRAIQLYVSAAADAVKEGHASAAVSGVDLSEPVEEEAEEAPAVATADDNSDEE